MRLLRSLRPHLLTFIILPAVFAASLSADELSDADRALLDNRVAISRTLAGADSIAYARAESLIREGQRTVQSGEFLAQARATQMSPDRDVAGDRRRGQAMIEEGRAQVARGQAQMLTILRRATEQTSDTSEAERDSLVLEIQQVALDHYLAQHASEIIDTILEAGFDRIFFDRVLVHRGGDPFSHEGLRRKVYDAFLDADGDRFAVGRAFEPELAFVDNGDDARPILRFSDQPQNRIAMMAIEVFDRGDAPALLSVRAFSLDDWTLASAHLFALSDFKVPSDAHSTFESNSESDEATSHSESPYATLELATQSGVINRFEGLVEPYTFAIHADTNGDETGVTQTLALRLLAQVLNAETGLILSEAPFIRQTYQLSSAVGTVSWRGPHNAVLIISAGDAPNLVAVRARARGASGEVSVGQFSLPFDYSVNGAGDNDTAEE